MNILTDTVTGEEIRTSRIPQAQLQRLVSKTRHKPPVKRSGRLFAVWLPLLGVWAELAPERQAVAVTIGQATFCPTPPLEAPREVSEEEETYDIVGLHRVGQKPRKPKPKIWVKPTAPKAWIR